jgi:hypothetical protein
MPIGSLSKAGDEIAFEKIVSIKRAAKSLPIFT